MGETVASAIGAGIGEVAGGKRNTDETREARDYKAKTEDTSMRAEATYRAKRQMLQGAIEDFYKQKGWPLPTAGEGAYTTRPLPGDKPLYEGYNVPKASWNYGKISDSDVAAPEASTSPSPAPSSAAPQVDLAGITPPKPLNEGMAMAGLTDGPAVSKPMVTQPGQAGPELNIQDILRKYGY